MKRNGFSFFSNSSTLPSNKVWNLQLRRKHIWHRGRQCSTLCSQCIFWMCLLIKNCCFLNILHKSWESLLALQLPKMNLKNKLQLRFVQAYQKKRFRKWKCHVTLTTKGKTFLIWKCHVGRTKKERISLYGNIKWQWLEKSAWKQ